MSLTDTKSYVSMPSTPTTPTCDPEFFYSFVDFEVDGVCFCLPTQPFEQSPFFVELFKEQPRPSRSQGSAAQNVRGVQRYVLNDVSAEEFRDFLRILLDCPWRRVRTVSNVRALKFSSSAYLSFMKLATLWRFDAMREEVANDLYDFDNPAMKLLIGTKFEQKQLIPSALHTIVRRAEPLEPEDYEILGLDLAIRVAKCREYCRSAEGW
ncbi:hypothetical protein K466DRAFT_599309 [Polyporus arcularius HHB13444]|uniref:BTB domain-containing protein n=1 Tax=Polyporus arcularius HHB13444 TaxID=1314778 RepID=A0A5C3PNU0_9APHY|nr:hypothetical protein K466DRAFT_599309 [Polyporus arcularius HHB13444]